MKSIYLVPSISLCLLILFTSYSMDVVAANCPCFKSSDIIGMYKHVVDKKCSVIDIKETLGKLNERNRRTVIHGTSEGYELFTSVLIREVTNTLGGYARSSKCNTYHSKKGGHVTNLGTLSEFETCAAEIITACTSLKLKVIKTEINR